MSKFVKRFLYFISASIVIFLPTLAATQMVSADPVINEFTIPTSTLSSPAGITSGPDGNLWATDAYTNKNDIMRIDTSGNITYYPIPTANAGAEDITTGSDGALWFTEDSSDKIGRITTSGDITEYPIPTPNAQPFYITAGPDGSLWFTEEGINEIGSITTSGAITEYPLPSNIYGLAGITSGPDGALWFTGSPSQNIGRITTSGSVTVFPLAGQCAEDNGYNCFPDGITTGPDGALWIAGFGQGLESIMRMTTSGSITNYPLPTQDAGPREITVGPDGALWFTEAYGNNIGRITTNGAISEYPIPTANSGSDFIVSGPDGALWFTEANVGKIGQLIPNENTAPMITSTSSASTGMRTPFDFQVTTTGSPTPALSESGALPSGIAFTDNGDGTADISGSAAVGTNGTYPITITASNGTSPDATQNFTLTVTAATSPTAFTSPNTGTEAYGVPFNFTVTTSGYPVPTSLHRVEGDGSLPPGVHLVYNGDGTATLSGTPDDSAAGAYTFTMTATNGVGSPATQVFSMTITKAPVFKAIRATIATVGTPYSLTISTTGYDTPSLSTSSTLPNGLNFTDNGDGTATISGTPQPGSGAEYPITINATNSYGISSNSFNLKVDETPAITSSDNAYATTGEYFYFEVTATGYPSPNYSISGTLPQGIHFYPGPGTFGGTPAADTVGIYPLTITATNSQGTTSQSFDLTIL